MITLTGVPVDLDDILNKRRHVDAIPVEEIVAALSPEQRDRLIRKYDMRALIKIFDDEEAMQTVKGYLDNGMNISVTARNTYMHRNTLMYRLNKIRRTTGFDLKKFDMAVTFEILYALYKNK